jgi:hypothetical protein
VVLAALATAQRALPAYSHRYSPKKFTQHQLFACLALKSFLKLDYRGIVAHLVDQPALLAALKLNDIPHFTTLEKAAQRLLKSAIARQLLEATVRLRMKRRRRVKRSAVDSTGFEGTPGEWVLRPSATLRGRPVEIRSLSSVPEVGHCV